MSSIISPVFGRGLSCAFIAAVVVASLYPLAWDPASEDSFPLSNYPMFSRGKKTPILVLRYAVAVQTDGGRRQVPPQMVANHEVLQARATILQALGAGRTARQDLCAKIAGRIAQAGAGWAEVSEVRLVSGRHDAVEYLTGRDTVGVERVHVRCEVRR